MKKRRVVVLMITVIALLTGCASLMSAPRLVHIQITGPANSNEFIIALDDLTQRDADISLSKRYAVNLDLQWLWYSREDVFAIAGQKPEQAQTPLTPWIICKYRF